MAGTVILLDITDYHFSWYHWPVPFSVQMGTSGISTLKSIAEASPLGYLSILHPRRHVSSVGSC